MSHQLFQPRKELNISVISEEQEIKNDHSCIPGSSISISSSGFNNDIILTENEKYTVSKLAPMLSFLPEDGELDGYIDTHSNSALCNDKNNLYIWKFNSPQEYPSYIKIPLQKLYKNEFSLPKCCLTWPTVEDIEELKNSLGVFISDRKSGLIQFYEDIDTIDNTLSLMSKNKVIEFTLNLKHKEEIIDVVNCEPAGILISTTFGRLFLVTIRDSFGKPCLKLKEQILNSHFGFFHFSNLHKQIVSLRSGPIVGKGERLLSLMTNGGNFQVWNISATINSCKRIDIHVYNGILQSLKLLYPFADGSLKILDSHPLPNDSASYVILSSIHNNEETYYIMSTINIDEQTNSFVIFSTYKLNTLTSESNKRPRLFIPSFLNFKEEISHSVNCIFIVFDNAVVLTQISTKPENNYLLKRRWEDIISFNSNIQIIGHGYDTKAIYLMDRDTGIMKIGIKLPFEDCEFEEVNFIKSHIDQAIYFSRIFSTPIKFDFPKKIKLEQKEVETDLISSSLEILLSNSKYIPPKFNNIEQHLNLRVELFQNLLDFTKYNFIHMISAHIKLSLLETFEILKCASVFMSLLKSNTELFDLWNKFLLSESISQDILLFKELNRFPEIFRKFLSNVNDFLLSIDDIHVKVQISKIINKCIYQACFEECEHIYRYDQFKLDNHEINLILPWFADLNLMENVNKIFLHLRYASEDPAILSEFGEIFLMQIKTLYYMFSQADLWFRNSNKISHKDYSRLQYFFSTNHNVWIQVLCQINLTHEAIHISDFYEDLEGLIYSLNALNETQLFSLSDEFFHKYGYRFAVKLFTFLLESNKLNDLFFKFEIYHEYLTCFFKENPQYNNISWIKKIFDNDYLEASHILTNITTDQETHKMSIEKRHVLLSIAKLSNIENKESVNIYDLNIVQSNLDTTDAQLDLSNKLEQGAKISTFFEDSICMNKVFDILVNQVKNHICLPVEKIIELYTLLEGKNNYFSALKLLSLNKTLSYEINNYLTTMIWRRCILLNQWDNINYDSETVLYYTLMQYFQEKLFLSEITLPIWQDLITDSTFSKDYLKGVYGQDFDIKGWEIDSQKEISQLTLLGEDFSTRVKSLIGLANSNSNGKCVINYEKNIMEH